MKLQRKGFEDLYVQEKEACKCLLRDTELSMDLLSSSDSDESVLRTRSEGRRNIDSNNDLYGNADFISGSVAIAERLFSAAKILERGTESFPLLC